MTQDVFQGRASSYVSANAGNPDVRRLERSTLLDLVSITEGDIVVDVQAGSGYVEAGLRERYGHSVSVISLEPSESLVANLPPTSHRVQCALERMPLSEGAADVALSLAGLHHADSLERVVSECVRVVRRGGQVALAEVEIGSPVDAWLNDFIDWALPAGHAGAFVKPRQLGDLLRAAGCVECRDFRATVPWQFPSAGAMVGFAQELFGIHHIERAEIEAELRRRFCIEERNGSGVVAIPWVLRYASAVRGN